MAMTLTVKQLRDVLMQHSYVLLRDENGWQIGINCKIHPLAIRRKHYKDNQPTKFVSYVPASFNEYITHKVSFI